MKSNESKVAETEEEELLKAFKLTPLSAVCLGLAWLTISAAAQNIEPIYAFTNSGFSGPRNPRADLIPGRDGNFYGTTADTTFIVAGNRSSVGSGTIFRITRAGEFTALYSFPGRPGGVEPVAGLLQASDGNFYGTCLGGPPGFGMVYRLSIPLAPVLQMPQKSSGGVSFKWTAVAGLNYQVQYKTNLNAPTWSDSGSTITATNGLMSFSDPVTPEPRRFYRVVLLQ